jgi:hypothetical protein
MPERTFTAEGQHLAEPGISDVINPKRRSDGF